ncbi:lipopolysaccharide-induced tumor necrosis factor-alpha factor-like [Leguminivora glycinivorella]|uniref:lipopolysaccharide-induced tumor necrosis factor-alpha factor-like n=1 Tax=Leguminivora glycinivorella TaxID=1035111 RepID=UPI00200FB514|nr:lipopolysaccharide-induced tumor necrosis factor-alpha factor-like [Leguminivora glycinivorella]
MDRPAPPPYSGYPPGPPGPPPVQVTHVVPGAVIIQHQIVGPDSTLITCRSCHQSVITRIDRRPSTRTHVIALLLCLFGFWPCVCLPYCMDSCLNTDHYCTNCGAFIGTYIG